MVIDWIKRVGVRPGDDAETRLRKSLLVASTLMMASLAVLWGALYAWAGELLSAVIPWGYSLASLVSLTTFAIWWRAGFFAFSQLLLSLLLPGLLAVSLGDFVASSGVIVWSVTSPLGALVFLSRRKSVWWFVAFAMIVASYAAATPYLPEQNNLSPQMIRLFFLMNLLGTSGVAFLLMLFFAGQRAEMQNRLAMERSRSDALLLNVLPAEIAETLKDGPRPIAAEHDEASVLFADMVGFTREMHRRGPERMVTFLNEVHTHFDALVDRYAVEKIRTIGDAYMVVAGAPRTRADHAEALARLALDMNLYAEKQPEDAQFRLRIGIASGPVIAGVIGRRKFCYDVWGDTVNLASRLEAGGEAGRIQISDLTRARLGAAFRCVRRGEMQIRGQSATTTWWLTGRDSGLGPVI